MPLVDSYVNPSRELMLWSFMPNIVDSFSRQFTSQESCKYKGRSRAGMYQLKVYVVWTCMRASVTRFMTGWLVAAARWLGEIHSNPFAGVTGMPLVQSDRFEGSTDCGWEDEGEFDAASKTRSVEERKHSSCCVFSIEPASNVLGKTSSRVKCQT
jgi:hypothetical protein